jgi:hypothetical protein
VTRFKEPYLELDTAGVIEPVLEGAKNAFFSHAMF